MQEAVSNIAKHAHARAVRVQLSYAARQIVVRVEDDGQGFDVDEALTHRDGMRGLGLLGMRERAALLGGTLTIHSQLGGGTQMLVEVPWSAQD